MKATPSKCDDQILLTLLRGDLPKEENERTLNHISSCEFCQQRLGELAASGEEWLAVTEAIKELPMERDGSELASLESIGRLLSRPSTLKWTESMAKQLLLPPSHPEMLGRLGRYEIERLIGAGGMGLVFKAFDRELNRPLAIKVLSPHLAGSGPARQRFAREARAAAAVVHPHVVPIYNVESEGEIPYLVMQYVSGESLQDRIDREGPLELEQILRIGMQVADGLAAAHQQGLVHRDIKPSNILLEDRVERALITDFGLARACDDASLTRTGFHPGTPHYMSPEQALGKGVDARSDLFSLGSMFYAMSTGSPPFRDESSLGVMRQIAEASPKPLTHYNSRLPDWWGVFVERLMAKSPVERFDNASEVHSVLKECLRHFESPANVTVPKVLQKTWWFSNRSSILFTGVLFMLSFLIFGFIWLQAPLLPENEEARVDKQVSFVSDQEKYFYELVQGVANSHGDWFGSAEIMSKNQIDPCTASIKSEGLDFSGIGSGFIKSPFGSPQQSHRISIAWPREDPKEGVMIGIAANCDYFRLSSGFDFTSEFHVYLYHFQKEDGNVKPSNENLNPLRYSGTWDPVARILNCEPTTVPGGEDGDSWILENSFQIHIPESGEIEVRKLPLGFDGEKRISCKLISRNGDPTIRQYEGLDILGLDILSKLGPGVSASSGGVYILNDEGKLKFSQEAGIHIHVDGSKANKDHVTYLTNVTMIGGTDRLIFGMIGTSVSGSTQENPPGYFWIDKATGKKAEGLKVDQWRRDLKELGCSEAPIINAVDVHRYPYSPFQEISAVFPWYRKDEK